MKINANTYRESNNCSEAKRPNITETRSCNSFACDADWDTEEGLVVSAIHSSLYKNVYL